LLLGRSGCFLLMLSFEINIASWIVVINSYLGFLAEIENIFTEKG